MGDIIAFLPSIRELGGGTLCIGDGNNGTVPRRCRENVSGHRFEAILPLLTAATYIHGVEKSDQCPKGTLDCSDFRHDYRRGENLVFWQARRIGLPEPDLSPWLNAHPNERHRGRVIFARSARYHNGLYPWFALIKRYPDAIFVGLSEEHEAFQQEFGCRIEYVPTSNLLDLAGILAVAKLVCANQSCPWWIAAGLGVTTFQETWDNDRNSMISRPNLYYQLGEIVDLDRLPK